MRVFIGSAKKWAAHEPVLEYSIKKNTTRDVQITFMRSGENGLQPSGCTGFTNYRFTIPELAGFHGFAIYLDIDMVVLGDIAEIWEYRQVGKWVCMKDGANEVSVIDCSLLFPRKELIHTYQKHQLQAMAPMVRAIPPEWNVKDRVEPGMKLLHFTDLRQNWIAGEHSCRDALKVLHDIQNDYKARQRLALA